MQSHVFYIYVLLMRKSNHRKLRLSLKIFTSTDRHSEQGKCGSRDFVALVRCVSLVKYSRSWSRAMSLLVVYMTSSLKEDSWRCPLGQKCRCCCKCLWCLWRVHMTYALRFDWVCRMTDDVSWADDHFISFTPIRVSLTTSNCGISAADDQVSFKSLLRT